MKKCTNCKCENLKGAKECTKCGGKFMFGNVVYKPKPISIFHKFASILGGLICTLVGCGILYVGSQEVIIAFTESASLGIILLNIVMFGIYLTPVLILFFMAYGFYFIAINSK